LIQKERLKPLNNKTIKNNRFVLYWMQASPRKLYFGQISALSIAWKIMENKSLAMMLMVKK
jgi:hypothetical protein